MIAAVLVVCAMELFTAFRQRGYQPATLLALVGTAAIAGSAYWRGEQAFPLVMALMVVFTLLWYLWGVVRTLPATNIGITILGFAYVGFLGAFAPLLLKFPDGIGMFLGAIIATVAYDVVGFFVGHQWGRTPLAPEISPNKTVEGLIGGWVGAVVASVAIVAHIHPWDFGSSLALGIVTAVAAPLGDLCESMIKRDLGVKDMGSILPGHGGLLDRIDALLFVVPATFYLVRVLDLV
jgi:phosphatidate cytidylyltransferase